MSQPTYNAAHFIAIVEQVPEDKDLGRWPLIVLLGGSIGNALAIGYFFNGHGLICDRVLDGTCVAYSQPTPKQRILAALRDIQAKENAQ